ncbi:MAG: 50S ribosomal protein L21e [Candidatus Hydrothermarchaeales archaeon]
MERSRGSRSRTRKKLKKGARKRGALPVTKVVQGFERGDKVHIVIDPGVQKGQPHPKFHGKTGSVVEKRGRSYLVEIHDKNAKKILISHPVHLKRQRLEG